MKRILLSLLVCFSLHAGVYIRTPVLAKVQTEGGHYYDNKELFEWGNGHGNKQVVSLCQQQFCNAFEYCHQPIHFVRWQALKDYYVYVLKYDNQYESLIVTGRQCFQMKCKEECPEWTETRSLHFLYENYPEDTIEIAQLPTTVNGKPATNRWAEVVSLTHITPDKNIEKEFFDVSVEETHTLLIGKGHIWAHNMGVGAGALWAFGEGAGKQMLFNPIEYQMNLGRAQFHMDMTMREHGRPAPVIEHGQIVYHDNGAQDTPVIKGGSGGPGNGTDPEKDDGRYLRKSIQSYKDQIQSHNQKIQDDRNGVNLPDDLPPELRDIVKQGQEQHHQKEIDTMVKNIIDAVTELKRRGFEP